MLFRNLTISLGMETGCQGGQGSPRAVAPSEEEEQSYSCNRPWRIIDVFPVKHENNLHIRK
jgi:hypothetical protein